MNITKYFRLPWQRKKSIVPHLRLRGVIGSIPMRGSGLTAEGVEKSLQKAFSMKKAKVVAISINSPGGSPVQSSLIARRIRQLAEQNDKKVLVFVEDVAASGGYYLACAGDEIIADPSSVIGSIGVISAGFGFQEAIAKLGIERRVNSTGAHKGMLDPFQPQKSEDLEILKELHQDVYQSFCEWVLLRRQAQLTKEEDELFSGRVWAGSKAVDAGLADHLGNLHEVLAQRFGDKVKVISVNEPRSWFSKLSAAAFISELLGQIEERMTALRLK